MIIKKALKQYTLTSFACLLFVIFSTQSIAAQLYRYKNEQGNLVMGHAIPPELVSKGYDILNAQGRIVATIPPALNAEQIAQRDAELKRKEEAKIARAIQDEIDENLKQLYSHPDDAVRILQRRVQDIESVIQVKKGRIDNAKKQIREHEEQAATRQRKGLSVLKTTFEKIDALQKDISNAEADILELQQEFTAVLSEFDIKIRRLELITKKKSDTYPTLLNTLKKTPFTNDVTSEADMKAPLN
jgi:chromosome segregation ATPase